MKHTTITTLLLLLATAACSETAARKQAGMLPPPSPATMNEAQASPQPASAPYDLQFLDTMSAHHAQAVEMAGVAAQRAQHAELKRMADQMVSDQGREIEQMKGWRAQWFASAPSAINQEMPGMAGMNEMMGGTGTTATRMDRPGEGMRQRLETAAPADFDLIFLQMMIPHHQGAITMSEDALGKAQHNEMKELARRIADAQRRELEQMRQWQAAWAKRGDGR